MEENIYTGLAGCDWCGVSEDYYVSNSPTFNKLPTLLSTIRVCVNWSLFFLFIILTILGIWLICRKHKGEKGLWKRIVKWELIFILIMFLLGIIASFILRYMNGIGVSGVVSGA